MAQTSTKFSIVPPRAEKSPSILDVDKLMTVDSDPTRDIRALIEQLQETSSEARVLLRQTEEERDALAAKVGRLQLELDSANELAKNSKEITASRDRLLSLRAADNEAIADLKNKFEACERLRAEATKQRDDLIRQKGELNQQKATILKQSEEAARQRDALRKSEAEVRTKAEDQKKRTAALEKELADDRKRTSELERELAEAHKQNASTAKNGGDSLKQIAALKQARDAATACVAELKSKVSSLEDQVADLSYERDASARKASTSAKQGPPVAEELEKVRQEAAKDAALAREANEKIEALQSAIGLVSVERDELAKQNGLLVENELKLIAERDAARKTPPAPARGSGPLGKNETAASIAEKYESQRMVTIELSAMLEKAQREIKEMGASLAEARLMLKSADRRGPTAQRAASQPTARKSKAPSEKQQEAPSGSETIRAMRKSLEAFSKTSDSEPLNELFTHAQALADQAGMEQAHVLHRVSSLLASLLHELYLMPEQVTESVVQTVEDSINFLGSMMNRENLDRIVKIDGARVYVVDDDQGVCEAVASSIRAVGLSVRTTQLPGEALSELAGNPYDLLVLDVQLPELDGFELCANIRSMELHAETPVIFLSGDGSLENRVQSSMCGGNDFVSKPFNFQEMGLKILVRILRAQLSMS